MEYFYKEVGCGDLLVPKYDKYFDWNDRGDENILAQALKINTYSSQKTGWDITAEKILNNRFVVRMDLVSYNLEGESHDLVGTTFAWVS